ncbi:hypothetical protein Q7C36_000640 [Tachysurus vachellii]|uniref:Myeloid leukemia factor 1 n=1 Tax=Tachysurus vachellii TaxID=175792 RepID=A0AA88P1E8_TACVA|nr:myeloid leukemia factor 1 [Tachysurus vachellii]KAK2868769.1 hypothetical protein Q7C36_000640 [Tachysurus vachellii]
MFNSLLKDFEDDPFFSDPFRMHNERMQEMMRNFSEPFRPSVADGRDRGHRQEEGQARSGMAIASDHRNMNFFRSPFATMDNMMTDMRNRMEEMHRNNEILPPDSHTFSSSSFMTYSKVGDEPAKVFKASTETLSAPGGIKETRRAVSDTVTGVEKMSIGHHIDERGHIIEKKRNKKTGEREFNQDFQNMDETEAQAFDDEWEQKVSTFQPAARMSCLEAPRAREAHQAPITSPAHTHRERNTKPAEGKKKTHLSELSIQSANMKKK